MKKLVLLLLVIVSVFSFGANFKPYLKGNASNPDAKKVLFAAQMESTKKVVTLYKDREKVVYVFGLEGKKPEIKLDGTIGENLLFNADENESYDAKFLVFQNDEYRYIVSYYDVNGKTKSYLLEAYKGLNPKPLYKKQLNNKTVYDKIFTDESNKEKFNDLFLDENYRDYESFYINY
ncbi:hypothetical protein RN96_05755 [Fusobacterium polymorphum]|uniref:Uncharacterized protein n=1 Tax=Fusobacterium nucleatum subsp. polymorphum TaxID=76857 RepID=A0A2B7YP31_FUSNP|nr:hypothetical protein [Fusobacterium polymorphum]PGH22618.1 hypothetical protein RN96_05755 [Fusobacterium polymorphum]